MKIKRKIRSRTNPRDEDLLKQFKLTKFEEPKIIVYEAYLDNDRVGYAVYSKDEKIIDLIKVSSEYWRRGIADQLCDYVNEDQNKKVKLGKCVTKEGMAFKKARKMKNPRDENFLRYIYVKKQLFDHDYIKYIVRYQGNNIAYADYDLFNKEIKYIQVDSEFRKRGVGSYLVDYIEEDQKIKLRPSDNLTQNGRLFWEKRIKNPIKKPSNLPKMKDGNISRQRRVSVTYRKVLK